MIVSKNGLMVVYTTKKDSKLRSIDNVYIERDGTTVGCGGKTVVLVSPVDEEVKQKLVESEILKDSRSAPMAVSSETVNTIIKDLSADKKYNGLLEHCNIKKVGNGCKVDLTDGKRKRTIEGKIYPREYLPYQNLIGPALMRMQDNDGQKIVLNKRRLLDLLGCVMRIAPDSSDDDPIYISFTDNGDIVIRGINYKTKQRFVACMWSYKGVEGKWLELNEWEENYVKNARKNKSSYTDNSNTNANLVVKNRSKKHKNFILKKKGKK